MIKIGVIGVGSMGQQHARVLFHSEHAQLVAVADRDQEQLEKVAKRYNAVPYLDYREMLQREQLEAVTVAVPTSLHHSVALAALAEKKHTFVEKPLALTEQQAREIIAGAEQQKVKLMVGHIERFNPAVTELKQRLLRGDLGEIYHLEVQRIGPFPARITDVGVITDLSVHDLDIIRYLLQVSPRRVYAEIHQKLHPTGEDSVTALLRYTNEALAVLNVNFLSPTKIRQLQVFGKKGMFKVNYLDQELYFYENKSFASDNWESVTEGDMKKIIVPKKEPLQLELDAFLHCIRNDSEPPVTGADGLNVLILAQQLIESAREQKIIKFPEL